MKIRTGIYFFLPLVVDATGPAQANYSLPGLFMTYPRAAEEYSYSRGFHPDINRITQYTNVLQHKIRLRIIKYLKCDNTEFLMTLGEMLTRFPGNQIKNDGTIPVSFLKLIE
jgi:hypothetical protein